MPTNIDSAALLLNSILTIGLGLYIVYSTYTKKLGKQFFYYLFGIGFIIYGIQIFSRIFYADIFLPSLMVIVSFLVLYMGLWTLSRKKLFSAMISVYVFVLSLMFLWKLNLLPDTLLKFGPPIGSFLVYIPILILIFYHRFHFGKVADKLAFGWALLFLANITTFGMGWITDLFAIFAKILIFYGIKGYDFIFVAQKIRDEMAAKQLPPDAGYEKEGKLKLILYTPASTSYTKQVNYIENLILEDIRKGINTLVFAFQDVIPHHELRRMKWINPEKVFILLFSASAERAKNEFTVFPMELTKIGVALSEAVKKSEKSEKGVIIFSNLSLLIHSFEPYPVYAMLLSKMGAFREKGVEVFAFMNPETHTEKSVVSLFTDIADEVIKL